MKNLAPIALFVYNRPDHLKQTIEALAKNDLAKESELYVFSDGPKEESEKSVKTVRDYLKTIIKGFKRIEIRESASNNGLANSIIAGVTELVNKHGKVIVLEDDLVSSPYFLQFMNEALDLYDKEDRVASVHGYIYPVKGILPETFFLKHTSSWGWATWKRAWDLFEPNGRKLMDTLEEKGLLNDFNINGSYNFVGMLQRQINGITNSWAIRWSASCLVNNKLNLYPGRSLIRNIGQDGSGEHKGNSNRHDINLSETPIDLKEIRVEKSLFASKSLENFYKSFRLTLLERILIKVRKVFKL